MGLRCSLKINLVPIASETTSSAREMEKSVAVASTIEEVKVSNQLHIPDDLTFFILSKLSLKSLKRFGCIRKSWALLFENPQFMSMYRNNFISKDHSYYNDTFHTFLLAEQPVGDEYHSELYLLSGERFENRAKLDWPPPFQEDDSSIYILGSVNINGIFCLMQARHEIVTSNRLVLWNPATKEFMVIPPSPVDSVPPYRDTLVNFYGFGYDYVRDDYKVIRRVTFFPVTDEDEDVPWEDRSYDPLLEIYSLRSNSWRKLDIDLPNCYYNAPSPDIGVYMDGVCHWWGRSETDNVEECVVSFDMSNEVLVTTPMPSEMDDSFDFGFVERHLVVLNGSIALISYHAQMTTFPISILGELGVRESWIKLFNVGPLPCVEHPIGVGKKGNIFFRKEDNELVWFDLSTQMIEELGIRGLRFGCHIGIYKESLLLIGGISN